MSVKTIKDLLYKLSLDSSNSQVLIDLGAEAFFDKHYSLAIDCYTKLINLNTNVSESFQNRGVCHLALKNYELAIENLNESIKVNNNSSTAYYYRGLAYFHLQNNQACNDWRTAYEKGFKQAKEWMDQYCDFKDVQYIDLDGGTSMKYDDLIE